jgi:uncharacterized protein (DUF1330 family)
MLHPIQSAAIDQLGRTLGDHTPFVMLNLLRFEPEGGRERYFGHYLPAFRAIAARHAIHDIAPIWMGEVRTMLAGPAEETWDAVLLVRYPSLAAFRTIVDSEAYRSDAAPHREAALRDWRLVAQTEMDRS